MGQPRPYQINRVKPIWFYFRTAPWLDRKQILQKSRPEIKTENT